VIAALSGDLPRLPAEARARFTEGTQRLPAAIAALLREVGTPDADAIATSGVAELVGALALARAIDDPERSDAILKHSNSLVKARFGVAQTP
jgi:TetR/AcrR family transcriptional repressor of nem operon